MILPENLMNLIRQGEGLTVEFKQSTRNITKDVYDTVCSFSNRDGGHIFLGVKDNGTILGVDKDCVEQMKKNFVTTINNDSKMYPPLYLTMEEYEINGCTVLYVYVPVGKTVYRNAGRIFDRNNESDIDITDNADMVFNLYARKQSTYFVNKVYHPRNKLYLLLALVLLPEMYAVGMYPNSAIPAAALFVWALCCIWDERYIVGLLLMVIAPLFRVDVLIVYPALLPLLWLRGKSFKQSLFLSIGAAVLIIVLLIFGFWLLKASIKSENRKNIAIEL